MICKLSNHVFDDPPKGLRIGGSALSVSKLLNAYRKSKVRSTKLSNFQGPKVHVLFALLYKNRYASRVRIPFEGNFFQLQNFGLNKFEKEYDK